MPASPFYFDWQFWSAIVAALALALSQLPPIHILLRRPRLRCETFSRLHLTHKVGYPIAQWHLILENTGGKVVRIKDISLRFSRTGSSSFELPAQNFLRKPESQDAVMLTPFRLAPGEEWAHIVNFFGLFSRDDEKNYRQLESAIRSDIHAQKEDPANRDRMCEADPALVAPLAQLFERQFRWNPGEYDVELVVSTDIPSADLSMRYRFSLFESESQELKAYADQYKHGAGLYWQSPTQTGILVPIHER